MADDLHKLLDYIVAQRVTPVESREAEMLASVEQDVPAEIAAQVREQQVSAERLAPFFAQGLQRARGAGGRLTVDDTDPAGNSMAEAFARYLVVPGLATSQSVELPGGGFRYTFDVDWPALENVARAAGVDLGSALRSS